jgi:hypothetical protein
MENSEKKQSVINAPAVYEAPAVEVLEVEVGKGFALSGESPSPPEAPGDGGGDGGWF